MFHVQSLHLDTSLVCTGMLCLYVRTPQKTPIAEYIPGSVVYSDTVTLVSVKHG